MDGLETLEFLSRSPLRIDILRELTADDELTRDAFRGRLDASRTTIQRNLEDLVERGFISQTSRSYTLNAGGEHILDELLESLEAVQVVRELQPFLEWVDNDDLDFSLPRLAQGDLLTPVAGDPYAMINRHVEKLKETTDCCALLPFTGLHAAEAGHDKILEDDVQIELVVEPSVVETYRSRQPYQEMNEEFETNPQFEMLEYDGEVPFALCILDETVQIIVADGDEPRAMVESTDSTLRAQARAVYEEYRAQATPVTLTS